MARPIAITSFRGGAVCDVLRLAGAGPRAAAFSYYRRLARVQELVDARYATGVTLAEAADVAGMEPSSFSRFFHRATGVCFRDWLTAVRVNRAMEIMAAKNLPVREVGRAVGFRTVRTFERNFLKVAGRTPIAYKLSVRPA